MIKSTTTEVSTTQAISVLLSLPLRLLIDNKHPKEAVKAFEGTDFSTIDHITSKGTLLEAYARTLLAAGKKIKAIETFDQLLQLNLPAPWKDRINQELDQMAEAF